MSDVNVRTPSWDDGRERIKDARNGCQASLSELLGDARRFLRQLAQHAIDSDIQAKLSASDLVQETLADAHHHFCDFQGEDSKQLMAWLRRILINNLLNHYRELRHSQKRDVSREMAHAHVNEVAIDTDTPSAMAVKQEEEAALEEELARLPEHYREVIELRHRHQMSFVQIAAKWGKSPDGVRMLWYRAFDQLSQALERRLG